MPRVREERVLTGAGTDSGLRALSRECWDLCSNIEDDFGTSFVVAWFSVISNRDHLEVV